METKSENKRPLILIGNDDGYNAKGITALIEIARCYGDVVAVAPADHQSGKSSALSVDVPLRVKLIKDEPGLKLYSVNGTPVDSIKLALDRLLDRNPDLVLSGINHGYNSGNSVINSGTMGVAFEGSFRNIPSIGFSYGDYSPEADFSQCEPLVRSTIETVLERGLPEELCLNINIPKCDELLGVKTVRAAKGYWVDEFEERTDPFGRTYYWLTGKFKNIEPDCDDTDLYWLERNYATVVPCRADQTAYDQLPR